MSSSAPGEKAEGDGAARGGRRRKLLMTLVKATIGLGILVVIGTQLTLRDVVELNGPDGKPLEQEVIGTDLAVKGAWVVTPLDGPPQRIPIEEFPILEVKGEQQRMRYRGPDAEPVRDVRLEGTIELTQDGERKAFDLGRVQFTDGAKKDGWVEKLPAYKEGLLTIFSRLSLGRYALAMFLIFCMYLCGITRWNILLKAQGLDVRFGRCFQLTFMGFFFNNVVPGLTGGDLVKAVMIAKDHPGKGAAAVSTVIADRVIGILILALMSATVLLFTFSRYETAGTAIFLFLGGVGVAVLLFFSRRIRRALRLNELLKKLPGSGVLMKLDQAFLLYRDRKGAVAWSLALSVGSHACNILSIWLMGMDLGVDRSAGLEGEPLVTYTATVPIILIVSSVPLLPGGWGLGELMFGYFFRAVGVRNLGLSVGLSVLSRASQLLWSLLGGVFLFSHRAETREALQESEDDPLEL